jgi:hemoglobin/transferrin/lactoferrin receptor protein
MPKPLAACIATLFATAATLHAQTAEDRLQDSILDEVIVTTHRDEREVFEVPYTAHVVTREEFLDRRGIRSLPDALRETPGVLVQRTSYGQASPFIRGFTGFRTLTLIDGIRLNNAVFREGPNQYFNTIDHLTVDRLDVVKGPSSVLYGSDAVGGTVNVITRSPEMLPWPVIPDSKGADGKTLSGNEVIQQPGSVLFHPGAYYRYATAENSHIARGEFSLGVSPHVGILGGVTWKDFDDLEGGDLIGNQPETGYREVDGDIKFLIRPNQFTDITAAFYRVEQNNVPRTHSTIFARSFDGTDIGTDFRRNLDQVRELTYIQAEFREVAPWIEKVNVSFSWHRQSEEQDRVKSDRIREITGFQDDQFGFVLNAVSPSPIGTLSYGAEVYHDAIESWGSTWEAGGGLRSILPRGPVADESSYDQIGVYLQDEFKPVDPLTILLGVRYSWAEARAGVIDPNPDDSLEFGAIDKTFDAVTGSARFRLDVARNWNFFGGVSQGFRAPNISDFTAFDVARSGEREVPAPNLDSEHYVAFEIGTKFRIERIGLEAYAAYFHTLIDNQIIRYRTGATLGGDPVVSKANVGDGYIHGVEIGANWRLPYGFTLRGNLAWTEGEVDTFVDVHIASRPASRIQPLTGLVGLRWESANQKWWIEGTAELARHQDRLSPGDMGDTQRIPPGGTRGYQVFSVRAGWKPCENLLVTAAVENVSDEDYRYLGSGSNEAGTNFIVASRLQF